MSSTIVRYAGLIAIGAFAFVTGCAKPPAESPVADTTTEPAATAPADEHAHSHGHGPHEGTLADWGGGKYHVEFTVDHDKKEAAVYVLGDDAKTPAPVAAKDGELLLSINDPSFQVTLAAAPQEGDPEGAASRYIGQHDSLGIVREFEGTISGDVDGTPFAGDFKEEPHGAHEHE